MAAFVDDPGRSWKLRTRTPRPWVILRRHCNGKLFATGPAAPVVIVALFCVRTVRCVRLFDGQARRWTVEALLDDNCQNAN